MLISLDSNDILFASLILIFPVLIHIFIIYLLGNCEFGRVRFSILHLLIALSIMSGFMAGIGFSCRNFEILESRIHYNHSILSGICADRDDIVSRLKKLENDKNK